MAASFTISRSRQSMVCPAGKPGACCTTTLPLSGIDRVPGLRHLVSSLHVFTSGNRGVAKVIREALSKTLNFYYPIAGRVLGSQDDVRLECTGDGVWFVEAVADCRLEDVDYLNHHPLMISRDNLLPPGPGSCPEINIPFMMQVTEFTCGGFVVGIVSLHTIADGLGAAQFINAIAEMARGLSHPTVEPVWCRELMPKRPTAIRQAVASSSRSPPVALKLQYSIMDIPLENINCVKNSYFELTGQRCSSFDVSVAHAWRSRTRAIKLTDLDAPVRLCFFASVRHLLGVLPPDGGYYGNCFYPVTVTASSGWVERAELMEVIRLIRDAKARLPEDIKLWASGGDAAAGDPYELTFTYDSLFVSDWSRLGFGEVDYGWGTPAHIIPFAYNDFMAVVILGSPPPPEKGVRLMNQCVKEEHFAEFHQQILSELG